MSRVGPAVATIGDGPADCSPAPGRPWFLGSVATYLPGPVDETCGRRVSVLPSAILGGHTAFVIITP